jgi:hypothetical protein
MLALKYVFYVSLKRPVEIRVFFISIYIYLISYAEDKQRKAYRPARKLSVVGVFTAFEQSGGSPEILAEPPNLKVHENQFTSSRVMCS